MIKFCNSVLAQYKARGGDAASHQSFENLDINKARPDYSQYLLRELDDEIHKHLPGYRLFLGLLEDLGVWQFSRGEFETVCKKEKFSGQVAEPPEKILEQLFDFSIIGFYRVGGKGYGGSEYVFRYRESRVAFDATAPRFRIHAGFIDALGLKRFTMTDDSPPA